MLSSGGGAQLARCRLRSATVGSIAAAHLPIYTHTAHRRCYSASLGGGEDAGGHGINLDHLKAEGDINLSPRRARYAARNTATSPETTALLEHDAAVFLHQSLSSPCINALQKAEGIYIEDLDGRRFMDFHGNSVHQVGLPRSQTAANGGATPSSLRHAVLRLTV
eukprot:SAG11_NODE_9048_length_949_cov_1.508235_2_plen_165_part_00